MPALHKIIKFPVDPQGNWTTIEEATVAADAHREDLGLEDPVWLDPDYTFVQFANEAAGVFINKRSPSTPDPPGSQRIDYINDYWYGVPPAVQKLAARLSTKRPRR